MRNKRGRVERMELAPDKSEPSQAALYFERSNNQAIFFVYILVCDKSDKDLSL